MEAEEGGDAQWGKGSRTEAVVGTVPPAGDGDHFPGMFSGPTAESPV